MDIKFLKILLILAIQGTISNMESQISPLKCVLFEEIEPSDDCSIFCDEVESQNIQQNCSVRLLSMNDTKMFIDVPKNLQMNIKNIEFEGDLVMFLPQHIHKVLPNLLEILAFQTSIKIAKKENFENLKNLTTLKIANGELSDICGAAFHDLQSLTEVDLSYNEIKFLHPNLFKQNVQLQKIDLNSNMLEILHPMLFSWLLKLSILDLSYNAITFIDKRQFYNNKMLTELQLTGNNIKSIEYGAFDGLQSLIELSIDPCSVGYVAEYEDNNMNINATVKFSEENCSKIGENQHEIEDKMNSYNKWFGSKYVADKCGSDEKRDYVPIFLKNSSVILHLEDKFWVIVSLIGVLNVYIFKL